MPRGRIPRKVEIEVEAKIYGNEDRFTLYVTDSTLGELDFTDNLLSFNIEKRLNQINVVSITLFALTSSNKNYVKEGSIFKLFYGSTLIMKGIIDKITFDSDENASIVAYGMEILVERSKCDRTTYQYTNTATNTITTALLNGIADITEGTNTNYGNISSRFENINKLKAISDMCKSIEYDWWVSHTLGENYEDNTFNVHSRRGSASSVYTFNISGVSSNVNNSEKKIDDENLATKATLLGYGDGINQLKSINFNATVTRTTLSSSLSSGETSTISLIDASDFDSSGDVWIGCEKITYSGKSGNNLTGLTRGVAWQGGGFKPSTWKDDTTGYLHNAGIEVYDAQYTISSPETDSAIDIYGIYEYEDTDRSIVSQDYLDRTVQGVISNQGVPIERIKIYPTNFSDIIEAPIVLGDNVTVTDADAGLSGDYKVVGLNYRSDEGYEDVIIELSNVGIGVLDQLKTTSNKQQALSIFSQGATNCYMTGETDNCDATHGLRIDFYVPAEAVAVNSVKLNYTLRDYRVFSNVVSGGSSHTHTTPDHSHQMFSYQEDYAIAPAGYSNYQCRQSSGGTITYVGMAFVTAALEHDLWTYAAGGGSTSGSEAAHTHDITYGISEYAGAWPVTDVTINVDGTDRTSAIETAKGSALVNTENGTENGDHMELKSYLSTPIADNWHYIIITPNNNCRIRGDLYIQIFIQSV